MNEELREALSQLCELLNCVHNDVARVLAELGVEATERTEEGSSQSEPELVRVELEDGAEQQT